MTLSREKRPIYQAVEEVVHPVVSGATVNEIIHMKFDHFAELQSFIQHLAPNIINNLSFKLRVTNLVKQHAQISVADETNVFDTSEPRTTQDE